MVAELKAKIPTEPKTICMRIVFDIRFDYDSFSNISIVIMFHGVSIKMKRLDLFIWLGFKENEILRGPTHIVSPIMANMERYTALYVYTDIIQNQSAGDVGAPLLQVVPVKSRYGDTACVTYEQPQFVTLSWSNIQTMKINIRSNTGKVVSFQSQKLIVTLVFRRKSLFHWCIDYWHLKEQHVKEVMVLAVPSKVDKNVCIWCEEAPDICHPIEWHQSRRRCESGYQETCSRGSEKDR